jgi:hypothetical protein
MVMRKLFLAVVLALALPACLAFAGGAGGVGFGTQLFDAQFSSSDVALATITGYGYGVSWEGSRIGGFGMALLSTQSRIAGGAGGMIVGHEWRAGPLEAALTLFGGVGGIGYQRSGYMIIFGEADFELGFEVTPWMQVVAYAGYQAWGNVIPGRAFQSAVLTTPVVGIRIGWGGF